MASAGIHQTGTRCPAQISGEIGSLRSQLLLSPKGEVIINFSGDAVDFLDLPGCVWAGGFLRSLPSQSVSLDVQLSSPLLVAKLLGKRGSFLACADPSGFCSISLRPHLPHSGMRFFGILTILRLLAPPCSSNNVSVTKSVLKSLNDCQVLTLRHCSWGRKHS